MIFDSYESLIDAILDRYLPEEAKPFDANDYVVTLREIDRDWPFDIENTKDLELAVNGRSAKSEGYIKMSAAVRLKSDPLAPEHANRPVIMLDQEVASDSATVITAGESIASGDKRKLVTPTKKSPPKKRKMSKSAAASGSGSKLPVRTRIIASIAELTHLGKPNPPRVQVGAQEENGIGAKYNLI